MIKNTHTICGKLIQGLSYHCKKRIIVLCDKCGKEYTTSLSTINKCRHKHNTDKDYCFKCSMLVYNTGDNNVSKRTSIKQKISKATLGKSKHFKDGKNLRVLPLKIGASGYIMKWSDIDNKHIQEHRLVYAAANDKNVDKLDEIHHIDGDKKNNDVTNLIELDKASHSLLHSQLENVAYNLVKRGIIYFNKEDMRYHVDPLLDLNKSQISYGFEDIAIKQQKNICTSRLDVDISSEIIRGVKIDIPIIAANMSTVINPQFYIKIHKLGAFAVLHRADTIENIIKNVQHVAKDCKWVAASIGITDSFDDIKLLLKNGVNIYVIDIAHGYTDIVLNLSKRIKEYNPYAKVVIGNTTNTELLNESYDFIDAIKVGIGQGFACETKNTAGCTEKQFSAILQFKKLSKKYGIPVISDGGIREPADFVKSIAAGANSIMAGKIFAECPESAAETITTYDASGNISSQKKLYAGMASQYVQEKWKGGLKPSTCAEGGIRYLDIGEPSEKMLERYAGALRSGITYSGTKNIKDLQNDVEFVILK